MAAKWVINQYGTPIGYRAPDGSIVYVSNAALLVIWHKRRMRGKG